jgi:ABC-type multidrug transport system fused ATPase/permease subunit
MSYARPHLALLVLALVLVVMAAAVSLAEPWPLAILVDSVLGTRPLPGPFEDWIGRGDTLRIGFVVALGLLVPLAIHGFGAVSSYVNTKLEMRMVLEFRSALFRHVQQLSFAYHDERRTGEFLGRINQQATSVGSVTVAVFPLLQSALTLIGMFVVAVRLNAPVALVALSVVPFIYLSTGYYGTRIGPEVRRVRRMEIFSIHIVHEAVQMLRVIVAFNREDHEYEKFRRQGEEAVDARVKLTRRQLVFSLVVNLITAAGTAAVIGVGAWQVRSGQLTVGELLVFLAYIAAVYTPLQTISTKLNTIQEQLIGFELAMELLESQPDVVDRPDAIALERAEGRISFDDVSFCYAGRERTLSNISFEVEPGQRIAIVGPTGAGKSTLAGLLPRFYDPAGGRILLDGHDLRDLTMESLRAQMSIVLQEPLLFQASITDNIRYGRLDADGKAIRAAATAAGAHDFVVELPKRYATKLGERGAKLSGGERQRIAVARAFLKDAPILILDEPTSSIDSRTESVVLEALGRLMEGRTTFMIAHRLSTVRGADQILVLNDGRIEEHGTHHELLRHGGLYHSLWTTQTVHGDEVASPWPPPVPPRNGHARPTLDLGMPR